MSAASEALLRQFREQRMAWLDVAEGKRLRLIRPNEEQMGRGIVVGGAISIGHEEAKRFVVDWSGYTQADFLGAAVGSSDPLPFSPELWAEYVADNTELYKLVAQKLLDMCLEHISARVQDRKN